jgi:hypothetical protein
MAKPKFEVGDMVMDIRNPTLIAQITGITGGLYGTWYNLKWSGKGAEIVEQNRMWFVAMDMYYVKANDTVRVLYGKTD